MTSTQSPAVQMEKGIGGALESPVKEDTPAQLTLPETLSSQVPLMNTWREEDEVDAMGRESTSDFPGTSKIGETKSCMGDAQAS